MAEDIGGCDELACVAEEQLPFGRDFFRELCQNLYDGVYFVDRTRRILFWNRSAEALSGYAAEEVVGSYCSAEILRHCDATGCELCHDACPLQETIDTGQPRCARVFLRHKDGRRVAVDVHVMPLRDSQGQIVGGVEVFRDASSAIALEDAYNRVRELAHKDALTGVANRRCLDSLLSDLLATFTRTGLHFSAILCDLDYFKRVNDRWGHPAGDAILQSFAGCLHAGARRNDLVGRYGGEEFMVLMPGSRLEGAEKLANRFRSTLAHCAQHALEGGRVTASFGVTEVVPGDTTDSLVSRVDRALYEAKRLGRDCVVSLSVTGSPSGCEVAVPVAGLGRRWQADEWSAVQ
jgi:diguanylate cyclase (GGDEF)-like protein/PAS domain S-box-containing protein